MQGFIFIEKLDKSSIFQTFLQTYDLQDSTDADSFALVYTYVGPFGALLREGRRAFAFECTSYVLAYYRRDTLKAMKFHFWHTTMLLFFVAVASYAYYFLELSGLLRAYVPLTDFFLMSLAIFRLVRLFTYDSITAFVREWFAGADPRSFLGTCGTLINCPWCTGLWFALVVLFFYFLTPIAWYAILMLALSSFASFIQILANLIGWSAEAKKKEAQSMPLPR